MTLHGNRIFLHGRILRITQEPKRITVNRRQKWIQEIELYQNKNTILDIIRKVKELESLELNITFSLVGF